MLAFSFTVPLTRVAVHELAPGFVAGGRAVAAGVCAAFLLLVTRQRVPTGSQLARVVVVAAGVVLGFPYLTSFALQSVDASHAAVVIAVLPAATAALSVLRTGERPPMRFWLAALAGVVAVGTFVGLAGSPGAGAVQGLGAGLGMGDVLLLLAVLACATGYAEGGLLSRELGSWQTICWALVVALPVTGTHTIVTVAHDVPSAGWGSWACFAYLGLVSMFLGFFAWYRGLGIGPMAQVSQLQLVQPVLSIAWAALVVGERLTALLVAAAFIVMACAAVAVRSR